MLNIYAEGHENILKFVKRFKTYNVVMLSKSSETFIVKLCVLSFGLP